jgi:hypothetical protein
MAGFDSWKDDHDKCKFFGLPYVRFKSKPDNGFDMTPEARQPQGSGNAAGWDCQVETRVVSPA